MKIGIDATPLSVPQAGVGTYTANLIRALRERGHDEVVPLLHRDVHPSFASDLDGIRITPGPKGSGRRLQTTVWMQTTLRRRIRAAGFDVCHFTNGAAPFRCACPHVVTIHDAGLWLHPEYHYFRRLVTLRPLIPIVARRAAAIIAVSHTVKRELVHVLGLPEAKVRVIHPGVSPRFNRAPLAADLARARQVHRLPERFILTVGSLEPRKNLNRLLAAHSALVAEPGLGDVGLVFAGPPGWKYRPFLDALGEIHPRSAVSVLGPVDGGTLVALYHLATVLAFPSLYEGFGLPLLEAMACGTPVVTSRGGALAEVAADAAELVDPLHSDSIAGGLRRVLDDGARAAELRQRGLKRAHDFTWERAARETRAAYAEISRASGPGEALVPRSRRGEPLTPDRADAIERAIMHTLAYSDLFDFPLTAGEVHRYLIGVRATAEEVNEVLASGRLVPGRLTRIGDLFLLPGREGLAEVRRARAAVTQRLMPRAVRYGRMIAGLPFVRMVAITGSLAARNADSDSDVDYLVVTAPERLWLCRAMVILLVRLARRRNIVLCPNYLLSESALELGQEDLYTAWELAQMVPVAGIDVYRRLRRRNAWTNRFLPNARDLEAAGRTGADDRVVSRGRMVRLTERCLRGPAGGWLERWERTRKVRRLSRAAAALGVAGEPSARDADFAAEWCKGHFGGHREAVMVRYRGQLDGLEREAEWRT
jgi:glycosyltransferase involved in cell wall biosynthesis